MVKKEQFELISNKNGEGVYNIMPVSDKTIEAFKIEQDDFNYLRILAAGFSKSKGSSTGFVDNNINKCMVVRIEDYPLPAFITKDGSPVVNISVMPSKHIADFASADVYAMFLYALSLKVYITQQPFEKAIESHISDYIFSIFMKLYSKKHGLQGSYKHLIPNLQALIGLYVSTAIMGNELNKETAYKISSRYFVDLNKITIPENINTTIGFIQSIKKNNIISISENSFSSQIITMAGVTGLPLFEDGSRFFATLAASSISGNSLFSSFFRKVNTKMFEKLVTMAMINAQRALR